MQPEVGALSEFAKEFKGLINLKALTNQVKRFI
jgi:hypothetical protein